MMFNLTQTVYEYMSWTCNFKFMMLRSRSNVQHRCNVDKEWNARSRLRDKCAKHVSYKGSVGAWPPEKLRFRFYLQLCG